MTAFVTSEALRTIRFDRTIYAYVVLLSAVEASVYCIQILIFALTLLFFPLALVGNCLVPLLTAKWYSQKPPETMLGHGLYTHFGLDIRYRCIPYPRRYCVVCHYQRRLVRCDCCSLHRSHCYRSIRRPMTHLWLCSQHLDFLPCQRKFSLHEFFFFLHYVYLSSRDFSSTPARRQTNISFSLSSPFWFMLSRNHSPVGSASIIQLINCAFELAQSMHPELLSKFLHRAFAWISEFLTIHFGYFSRNTMVSHSAVIFSST